MSCLGDGDGEVGIYQVQVPDRIILLPPAALSTHACDLCACFWLPAAGHLSKGEDKTSKTMENTQQRIQDNGGKDTGLGKIFQLNLLRLLSGFI